MEFQAPVQQVFQRRYRNLLHSLMEEYGSLVAGIEGAESPSTLAALDTELRTITGFLNTTVRRPGGLLDELCDFLKAFSPYLDVRGLYQEQLYWAQSLLKYFRDHATHEEDAIDMSLLLMIAAMYHRVGDHEDALEIYNFVLSIDYHRETHPGFALTYHNMALVYLSMGDVTRATQACRRALEIDYYNENPRGIARGLMLLADLLEHEGKLQEAANALREALNMEETLNNPFLRATLLGKIAVFAAKYHSEERAHGLFKEAIATWKTLGDEVELAIVQFNYAVMLQEVGNFGEAQKRAHESLTLLERNRHFRADHVRATLEAWKRGEDAPPSVLPNA